MNVDPRDFAPVIWRDGILIAPQHLQRQDLGHQAALHARLHALSPYAWGALSLRVDDDALRREQVRVQELRAVLPDGAVIEVDGGAGLTRALADAMPATARTLDVAIGLPQIRDGAENYDGELARYRTVKRAGIVDLAAGRSRVDLEVAAPNLSLLLGDEARQPGVVSLKIGEIVRGADGALAWSGSYIPPCLSISAARGLVGELRSLLGVAIAKRRALAELRREGEGSAAAFLGRDITHYLLLEALSAGIPRLRHLVDDASAAPLDAYLALLDFAGRLSAFATQIDPATFPPFTFLDLRASFEPLLRALRGMLGVALREGFVRLPLALRQEDGMWLTRLADDALVSARTHVLAVESSLPAAEVAELLPRLAKLATWGRITGHITQATPGARITHLRAPPPEIPARPRQLYFAIEGEDPEWRQIVGERTLAVYVPEPFDPRQLRVELIGVVGNRGVDVGGDR
ncbi:MAG: type VI secretion system baseplate subunit TssK [Nannocystis sp.]|nr:type VI secretion system baseplate subunit TssK [Nannocystis sp.]